MRRARNKAAKTISRRISRPWVLRIVMVNSCRLANWLRSIGKCEVSWISSAYSSNDSRHFGAEEHLVRIGESPLGLVQQEAKLC